MRIVFMGTPEFAVPSLRALLAAGHEICGVFSQPDKPVGRHQNKLQPTPVKVCALEHNVPVFQPATLRDGTALEQIRELAPELIVVAAYGRILPEEILSLPEKGCINVHSSLLPKYRGAAPINWAVINGETETGVTIMYMAKELDAGDVIAQVKTPIDPEESVEEVHDRLAQLGGELLVQTVERLAHGTAERTAQAPEQVTYAPMLSRALSPIDWNCKVKDIHNKIRGLTPWPAASTDVISGDTIKIYKAHVADGRTAAQPGTIVSAGKDGIDIACGDGGILRVTQLQAAGGKRLSAGDYLRGHPIER
jgi:methionyl-tRNA formyltransferase